jgi:L-fuculose-phosphate aldolase
MTIDLEWARGAIVAVSRRLYERGLVAGAEGNVSVRLDPARVLATPSGVSKGFLEPGSLVVTDIRGRKLAGEGQPSSELKMHLRIYELRPDVHAVVHAHPPTATGFAIAGLSFDECVVPEIIATLGRVPLVPYATPSTDELPERIVPYVAAHDALLLANHGAVTYGPTLDVAIHAMESIEQGARSMLVAHLLGNVNRLSRAEVDRLLALGAYTVRPRNPGCSVTDRESLARRAGDGTIDSALTREIAEIVREALGRSRP